jgi:hypothetical protein
VGWSPEGANSETSSNWGIMENDTTPARFGESRADQVLDVEPEIGIAQPQEPRKVGERNPIPEVFG